ncbi:MAG: glutamine--fructose-6-phosphate transaminase (isomerizing) [Candidatus Pacearchaeota archaeon]
MCGIAAYYGNKKALPILLSSLKKLEYRGYDSCGLAIFYGNKIYEVKTVGKVDRLIKQSKYLDRVNANIGIAHTRWATHGEVNIDNTHPIFDCSGNIAVIHNGIIENFKSLKEFLKEKNHKFKTQTDTEIIPHLFEEMLKKYNEKEAWINVIKLIEGAYAIIALYNGKLFLARKSSPLVIGIDKNEFYIASDTIAIPINKFIFLNDNELAIIDNYNIEIMNLNGEKLNKELIEIKKYEEEIDKKNFESFMLKEIFEQGEIIENIIKAKIAFKDAIPVFGGINFDEIKKFKRIIFFGCGSSYNAALYAKYLFDRFFNCDVELASEFKYNEKKITKNDLLVAISQSGETIDVLEALRENKKKALKTLGIVNVVSSSIAREVDGGIYLHAGREIGVAATKTFTAQCLILFLFWLYLARKFNYISISQARRYIKDLINLPSKIRKILLLNDYIKKLAKKYINYNNALFLGRKFSYPIALEGALKLKEIAYVHVEAITSGEMKHGPIALIDDKIFTFFISPHDSVIDKVINNMQEIKARKGKIIVITTKGNKLREIIDIADDIIIIPNAIEELQPILCVIPLQLFAYHIAKLKGYDVDKPRNLAKTVTVE